MLAGLDRHSMGVYKKSPVPQREQGSVLLYSN